MSRKNRKNRKNHPAAAPMPSTKAPQSAVRRKSGRSRDYSTVAAVTIAVFAVIGAYLLWQSQSASVSYRLNERATAQEWSVQGKSELTPNGIRLTPEGRALLISPELKSPDGGALHWRDFPYFKLQITPEPHERVMYLFWIPGEDVNNNGHRPFTVPAEADEVLVDVRQKMPWKKVFSWDRQIFPGEPIGRIGVLVQNAVEIGRIDLLSTLNPLQLTRLAWKQYWMLEPIKINSINFHYGNEIMGTPLTVITGAVFVVLFAAALIARWTRFRLALLWGMFACLALATLPFNRTLWNYAEASGKTSAWHADRHDEYRSRFNREFADLDKAFLSHVPKGSQVGFPMSKKSLVQGETNWIWFLYYGLYDNYRDRRRGSNGVDNKDEYVFYYHPKDLIHDEKENTLRKADKKHAKIYKTQTVARVSEDAKILKLIHD